MKPFSNTEIKEYLDSLTDLQRQIVLEFREIILSADEKIKESIKWRNIAFHHKKNICGYRIAKTHVTLVFMEGASLEDRFEVLGGGGNKVKTYQIKANETINKEAVIDLVKQSIEKGL